MCFGVQLYVREVHDVFEARSSGGEEGGEALVEELEFQSIFSCSWYLRVVLNSCFFLPYLCCL